MLTVSVTVFLAAIGLSALLGPTAHGYGGLAALGAFYYFASTFLGETAWRRFLAGLLVASTAMCGLAIVQIFFIARSRGVFGSPNFFGGYAALHVFLALACLRHMRGRWRWLPLVALGANGLSVALSQSRGAIAALACGSAVYAWRRFPRQTLILSAAFAVALAGITYARMSGIEEPRFGLWLVGFRAALQKLVFGWGPHGVNITGVDVFYSVPLDWLIWGGIVGLSAGAWMLAEGMLKAKRLRDGQERVAWFAFFVAWIVNGLFIFDTPAIDMPLFVALAYLGSECRDVSSVTRRVDHDQPLLNGRVTAEGAD